MTSTTSDEFVNWRTVVLMVCMVVMLSVLFACNDDDRIVTRGDLKTKQNYPPTSTQAEPQGQPKSPPTTTAPAENSDDKKEEPPFYGSTYWDEVLTSVYFYPNDKATHLKFGHREDDIWLCGDQRKSFEPGTRYKLMVTFEPNAPCITNWRVK